MYLDIKVILVNSSFLSTPAVFSANMRWSNHEPEELIICFLILKPNYIYMFSIIYSSGSFVLSMLSSLLSIRSSLLFGGKLVHQTLFLIFLLISWEDDAWGGTRSYRYINVIKHDFEWVVAVLMTIWSVYLNHLQILSEESAWGIMLSFYMFYFVISTWIMYVHPLVSVYCRMGIFFRCKLIKLLIGSISCWIYRVESGVSPFNEAAPCSV